MRAAHLPAFYLLLLQPEPGQQVDQGVHILLTGGPAGGNADGGMRTVGLFPEAGIHVLVQLLFHLILQNGKDLVGGRAEHQENARFLQGVLEPCRVSDGSLSDLVIETVRKEGVELDAQDPSLGQKGAPLLDDGEKVRQKVRIRNDQCFAQKGPALGAADLAGVAELCKVGEGDCVFRGGQGIGQPGSVSVERDLPAAADLTDRS